MVTVEDNDNKIDKVIKEMKDVKSIKLIKTLRDGTKQYNIVSENDKDIRKDIFERFAKSGITIFELKKSEATLEEAFIGLIDKQKSVKVKSKEEAKKEKKENKNKGGNK